MSEQTTQDRIHELIHEADGWISPDWARVSKIIADEINELKAKLKICEDAPKIDQAVIDMIISPFSAGWIDQKVKSGETLGALVSIGYQLCEIETASGEIVEVPTETVRLVLPTKEMKG